jgi:UPF0042 nucleotide-binding protein
MSEFIVITGLSGAGRSQAADDLEDLGWFVIDNLPPSLIPKVAELARAPGTSIDKVALVVGTGQYHEEVADALDVLRGTGARVRILFLDASDDVLVRRYEGSRRRHPLATGESVGDAIEHEREILGAVKEMADVVVDTSELNVHQLRARLVDLFGGDSPAGGLQTSVVSFGYKNGVPLDVDIVLDCRFLPNPHWVDELRPLTGLDEDVRRYVVDDPQTKDFLERLDALLGPLLPAYVREGKTYLTIALGCTGGRHRSVVMAEEVARLLRRHGFEPTVTHRDVDRAEAGS